jgi:hypothetical protein
MKAKLYGVTSVYGDSSHDRFLGIKQTTDKTSLFRSSSANNSDMMA